MGKDVQILMGKLIFIIGTDGAGKTHISDWLLDRMQSKGIDALKVWSRFNNYLSKPLLAVTRLTGHNYYRKIDGVLFGYHDFERLWLFREVFAFFQGVDVNLATKYKITNQLDKSDVVICERGPWDTLVDVIADTGIQALEHNSLGKLYVRQLSGLDCSTILIDRTVENIVSSRPELVHDKKLASRRRVYKSLAARHGWVVINNNGSLEDTKRQLLACIQKKGLRI